MLHLKAVSHKQLGNTNSAFRYSIIKNHTLLVIFILIQLTALGISAKPLPGYSTVSKRVPVLWASRYPIKVYKFTPNPEKKGVLSGYHKGKKVYYFHFQAFVYRPQRDPDLKISYGKILRKVEFWVRYRSWLKDPYDLSFARRDLLPGKHRRWIKSK